MEKHFEEMGEGENKTFVCFGKLRDSGYNPKKPPLSNGKNIPTWWNHMTFWITKEKIFISMSMVNWETL